MNNMGYFLLTLQVGRGALNSVTFLRFCVISVLLRPFRQDCYFPSEHRCTALKLVPFASCQSVIRSEVEAVYPDERLSGRAVPRVLFPRNQ